MEHTDEFHFEGPQENPSENKLGEFLDNIYDRLDEAEEEDMEIYGLNNLIQGLKEQYAPQLREVGLDVNLVWHETKEPFLQFTLPDAKKFTNYIASLSQPNLTEKQSGNLANIVVSLVVEGSLFERDALEASGKQASDVVGDLRAIVDQSHLFFDQEEIDLLMEKLDEYQRIAPLDYLPEYIGAINEGLLDDPDHGGPGSWHTLVAYNLDLFKDQKENDQDQLENLFTMEDYRKYWEAALDIVKILNNNPRANEFKAVLVSHLQESLRYAKEDLLMTLKKTEEDLEKYETLKAEAIDKKGKKKARKIKGIEKTQQAFKEIVDSIAEMLEIIPEIWDELEVVK
jgi:hypothetical protein